MRTIITIAAGMLAAGAALGEEIGFEDINLGGLTRSNFADLGIENTYRGYQWSRGNSTFGEGFWGVVNNSDGQSVRAFSGNQMGWNWNGPLSLSITFNVDKIVDSAYFNVFSAGQDWGADTIRLEGYNAANQLVATSSTLQLDDVSSNPAWQRLDANFVGVRRLQIVATQGDSNWAGAGWWAIDNLTVRDVPAPGAAGLLGMALLAGARRRR